MRRRLPQQVDEEGAGSGEGAITTFTASASSQEASFAAECRASASGRCAGSSAHSARRGLREGDEGDDGRRDTAKPHSIVDARAAIRVNGTSQAAE